MPPFPSSISFAAPHNAFTPIPPLLLMACKMDAGSEMGELCEDRGEGGREWRKEGGQAIRRHVFFA